MRALIYARVSLDARGEGRSVAEQVKECQAWADREGWTVTATITETGSASRYARSTGARTRWAELTEAVSSREHDILLTWESSRATRQIGEYAELVELCRTHLVLWGYSGAVYDLSTRDGLFRTGLDALLSQDESARTSERISRAVRARAAAGAPHGKIPFGYRREYDPTTGALLRQVPHEETAPIVREVYQRIAAGVSLNAIARDLTARGIPTPRPAKSRFDADAWIAMSVRRIIRMPAYNGKRVHQGEVVGQATWPALIDDDLWARANAAIDSHTRTSPTDSTARWLLAGIAQCGLCHGPVRRIKNGTGQSYTCKWCYKVSRVVAPTDDVVTRKLLALLELAPRGGPTSPETSPEALAARDDATMLRARLDALVDQATDGQLSATSLARAEQRLLPQIRASELRARTLSTPPALAGYDLSDPAALWKSLDMPGKRTLLRRAVRVTIHPAGGSKVWRDDLIDVEATWL